MMMKEAFRYAKVVTKFSTVNSIKIKHVWGIDRLKDIEMFRFQSYNIIDELAGILVNVNNNDVLPKLLPNQLDKLISSEIKQENDYDNIINELKKSIIPNITRFDHKGYFSWFPCLTSYPAALGNMINNSFIHDKAFSYHLENIICNWFKEKYMNFDAFKGENSGSIIYFGAGLATINAALAAKREKIKTSSSKQLRYYISEQAHYSLRKAANIAGGKATLIPVKFCNERKNYIMDAEFLENTIKEDIKNGFLPCFISATIGTTGTTAIDDIEKIGLISKKYNAWFHIDAAYAGSFLLLKNKFSHFMKGVENANSFVVNLAKLLPVLQNGAIAYYSDMRLLKNIYFSQEDDMQLSEHDQCNYENTMIRIDKSLKIYTAITSYGFKYFEDLLLRLVNSAKKARELLEKSNLFEFPIETHFGLICFRIKNKSDEEHYTFIKEVNASGRLLIGPMLIKNIENKENNNFLIIRLSVNYQYTDLKDIEENIGYLLQIHSKVFPL